MEDLTKIAIDIAENGTVEEKAVFVEYIISAINWHSCQGNQAELAVFEAAYKAYLTAKGGQDKSVKVLVEESGKSKQTIYNLAKKLGRLPTVEELQAQKKKGRPRKYL